VLNSTGHMTPAEAVVTNALWRGAKRRCASGARC